MNTHTGQAKVLGKLKINNSYTDGYDKPCLKFPSMGGKIDTFINHRNTEWNSAMMEVFYFRLLPVTCRNWKHK